MRGEWVNQRYIAFTLTGAARSGRAQRDRALVSAKRNTSRTGFCPVREVSAANKQILVIQF
jgi:hypothetical protein